MKRKEMRELTVYYCDWCMNELTPPMATITPKYENELHFHPFCLEQRQEFNSNQINFSPIQKTKRK
jgi:hypothetical protein